MGQEATCTATVNRQISEGKVLLEADRLVFRGDFRLAVPFKAMASVSARGGRLSVRFPGGVASFDLGPAAEKWAARIRNPRSLLDKLGVKPGSRVAVLGVGDEDFGRQLRTRTSQVYEGRACKNCDIVFFAADSERALERLRSLQACLKRDGAIWVVRPKGDQRITERGVMAAGRKAGLVDVKVVSFSATQTAEKFVIPVARR